MAAVVPEASAVCVHARSQATGFVRMRGRTRPGTRFPTCWKLTSRPTPAIRNRSPPPPKIRARPFCGQKAKRPRHTAHRRARPAMMWQRCNPSWCCPSCCPPACARCRVAGGADQIGRDPQRGHFEQTPTGIRIRPAMPLPQPDADAADLVASPQPAPMPPVVPVGPGACSLSASFLYLRDSRGSRSRRRGTGARPRLSWPLPRLREPPRPE